MSGMDKILAINGKSYRSWAFSLYSYHTREADGDLICQSGVRWEQINETLKELGIPLFFPVGMISYTLFGKL